MWSDLYVEVVLGVCQARKDGCGNNVEEKHLRYRCIFESRCQHLAICAKMAVSEVSLLCVVNVQR